MQKLTAAQYVKECGFQSLKQVADMSGTSRQTLNNWFHNKTILFEIVVLGCQQAYLHSRLLYDPPDEHSEIVKVH